MAWVGVIYYENVIIIYLSIVLEVVLEGISFKITLILFRMGLLGAAHGCHINPTMMKLGTVRPGLKKIQKIYK